MSTNAIASDGAAAKGKAAETLGTVKAYSTFLAKGGAAPGATVTRRSFLQATRYILRFVFFRLVRYAKYMLVGAAVAAVGSGVLGTLTAGVGWLVFPTSVPAGATAGFIWAATKFGWRRFNKAHKNQNYTGDARLDERADADNIGMTPHGVNVWERADDVMFA